MVNHRLGKKSPAFLPWHNEAPLIRAVGALDSFRIPFEGGRGSHSYDIARHRIASTGLPITARCISDKNVRYSRN
jgi:hypothetical protein